MPLRFPFALYLNHTSASLTADVCPCHYSYHLPCEWALHRQVACNNLLISLPWALSPTWPSSAQQNTLDTCVYVDVCAPPEYLGCQLSPQHSFSSYHKALAGRGCMPRGHEGRGGRYPLASSRFFWPTMTLTSGGNKVMEYCCRMTVDEEAF